MESNPRELRYINLRRPQTFVFPKDTTDDKLRCIIESFAPTGADAYTLEGNIYFGSNLSIGGPIYEVSKQSLEYRVISVQYIKIVSE